jgi:hypothetical protein
MRRLPASLRGSSAGRQIVKSCHSLCGGGIAAFLSSTKEFRNVVKRHADFLSAKCLAEIREYQSMGIASFSV